MRNCSIRPRRRKPRRRGYNRAALPTAVFLDGAQIRCRPEYRERHLDIVVGKVESPNMSQRFGLVQQAASSPAKQLRHDLIAQCWDGQSKVAVISDGESALPNLVRRVVRGPVTHILDWCISRCGSSTSKMRCRDLYNRRTFQGCRTSSSDLLIHCVGTFGTAK